jgi:hypothetical protein
MIIDEKILPLSRLLTSKGFSVVKESDYVVVYLSPPVTLRLVYDPRITLFYFEASNSRIALTEITPEVVSKVFNDDSYRLQSTLTIDDLVHFLSGKGVGILAGDVYQFRELERFSDKVNKSYHEDLMFRQQLRVIDHAWNDKDYRGFIKAMNSINQQLLPGSYLKKHQIASAKIKAAKQ